MSNKDLPNVGYWGDVSGPVFNIETDSPSLIPNEFRSVGGNRHDRDANTTYWTPSEGTRNVGRWFNDKDYINAWNNVFSNLENTVNQNISILNKNIESYNSALNSVAASRSVSSGNITGININMPKNYNFLGYSVKDNTVSSSGGKVSDIVSDLRNASMSPYKFEEYDFQDVTPDLLAKETPNVPANASLNERMYPKNATSVYAGAEEEWLGPGNTMMRDVFKTIPNANFTRYNQATKSRASGMSKRLRNDVWNYQQTKRENSLLQSKSGELNDLISQFRKLGKGSSNLQSYKNYNLNTFTGFKGLSSDLSNLLTKNKKRGEE